MPEGTLQPEFQGLDRPAAGLAQGACRRASASPMFRVAMREIDLTPAAKEPPVRVYDPSGPYTDPAVTIDIRAGLPPLREPWIRARGDVEEVRRPRTCGPRTTA